MITCSLKNGLGSQLFQIATTLALALDNDDVAVFDLGAHQTPSQGRQANQYLDSIYRHLPSSSIVNIDKKYVQPFYQYAPIPYQSYMGLEGLFHSEKFFDRYRDRLLDLFAPTKKQFMDFNAIIGLLTKSSPSCAIHVRRGDYLSHSNYHPILDIDYYLRAIELFPDDTIFIVFSDDINWCKANFTESRYRFLHLDDVEDLYLMSFCQHQIIANSTFSWWGSWLNRNPSKTVIAPEKWFCGAFEQINTQDLYPDWMIKI